MVSILEGINSPEHVKKLSLSDLDQLAAEIRERLITVLSNNGGHLGPNLGVVELTIALHYVFNTPGDSFLFDVSHQAYVHKLLTGREKQFHTIRTPDGLNGFMLRTESPHDCYGAGHAGTALSAALGMAAARDKTGGKEHVVAVAGDAAFTCGITYEALNNIAHHTKRLIVVLNDNEWSIDKNVGAIASYLHKIVTSPRFDYLHDRAGKLVEKMGGETALRMARKAEEVAKGMLWPSVIFEELGLKYFGPIDGHDTATLIKTFEFLKKQDRPVLLHVLTQKGRGFEPAMQKQKKFHGLGPYDPETGETKPLGRRTYSEVFADTLVKLADMLFTAMHWDGPIAVRYPRGLGPGTPVKDVPRTIPIGKAELLQNSDDDRVAILALGAMLPMAEEIARKLEGEGIAAAVINARFAKPIDVEMLEFFAGTVEVILTLEDHVLRGGFGSAVLEELNTLGLTTPVVRIGWPDQFIEHGTIDALRAKYGITPDAALEKLRPYLKVGKPQPV
jgi:deoxyxylulose-5-phosphate synthase